MRIFPLVALPLLVGALTNSEDLFWSKLDVKLRTPVSDMTTTLGPDDGLVYIAGGCIHESGSVYSNGFLQCATTTDNFYSFDPSTTSFNSNSFRNLPKALRNRYRHAAAIANGKLYLVGGRTVSNDLILEVDVYDIETEKWSTIGNLPTGISDCGAFSEGNNVYIVGGFDQQGEPQSNVWRINAAADILEIQAAASLNYARGDIKAYNNGQGQVFVAGGFNYRIADCLPLDSIERYDVNMETWSISEQLLNSPRGDLAFTGFDGNLVAIGGEQPFDLDCNVQSAFPAEDIKAVDTVELLAESGVWETIAPIPEPRLKFDAVSVGGKTFVFGGENKYDLSCGCFQTTDEILVLQELKTNTPSIAPSIAPSKEPTGVDGLDGFGGICFSGESVVEVLNRGAVAMKDLSIGDKVQVQGGKFSEVYSFGHYDQHVLANYLSIDAGLEKSLIISPDHMVFVDKKAIPASAVKIGDKLTLVDGVAAVKSIKSVVRTGAFAPFTKDGTVVVNDVVASSYVSLQPDSGASLVVGRMKTLSMHHAAHLFQAPHRLVCELSPGFCTTETYSNGLSVWVEAPLAFSQWLLRQNAVFLAAVLLSALSVVCVAAAVEAVILSPALLLAAIAAIALYTRSISKRSKNAPP